MSYVYKMYVGEELKYVGHTKGMYARMATHFTVTEDVYKNRVLTREQAKSVTKIEYVETGSANARVLEAYLIAKYKPEWNKDFVEDDSLTFELVTGELDWKDWPVTIDDNPQHHIFVWKDNELLYEIPKVHSVYDELCKELGIDQGMNFSYNTAVYSNGYKIMRLSAKRRVCTGVMTQKPKYRFMGYPEE